MDIDFITLANIIFKDKDKYKFVTDKEKSDCFFKLNRKFAFQNLKKAQFFNNKNIDKSSATDVWFQIFYNLKGTPDWWWKTKQTKIVKSNFSNEDLKIFKSFYKLSDTDINFLIKYEEIKVKESIKKIKKFKK